MDEKDVLWWMESQEYAFASLREAMDDYTEYFSIKELSGTETVDVYKMKRMEISDDHLDSMIFRLLDYFLDELDDDFADEGRDTAAQTPKMIDAAKKFMRAVRGEYLVTKFEKTEEKKTVNIRDWIQRRILK